jgi:hypothetical protein
MLRLITIVSLLVSGTFVDVACAQDLKQFLNIQAPKTALNAPYVFSLSGETTLIGLYYRDRRRDVSALKLENGKWKPFGTNGNAITGVGGNFISDVSFDKDGKPWLLTYYTRPSNSGRADRFFLYTIRNDKWTIMGPPDGHKADYSGSSLLFFLNGAAILSYRTWDKETKSEYPRLFKLENDQWLEEPAKSVVPSNGRIHLHQNQPLVVVPEKKRVAVFKLETLEADSLNDSQYSIELPANRTYGGVWFHNGQPGFVRLYDDDSNSCFYKCRHDGPEVTLQELGKPDDHLLVGVVWNRKNDLLIATNDLDTVRVYKLDEKSNWQLVSSAEEPSAAMVHAPHFSLLKDGTPIVTWEAFFPH